MTSRSVTLAHYLACACIIIVYGKQVCHFLDSLSILQLALPIIVTVSVLLSIRVVLTNQLDAIALQKRTSQQFKIDLVLFLLGGLALAAFNTIYFKFPIGSGAKVVFGMGTLGFFIACHLALHSERILMTQLRESGEQMEIDTVFLPLMRKFGIFSSLCVIVLSSILLLIVIKDLAWIASLDNDIDLTSAAGAILLEIFFVASVTMAYVLLIITKFGSNLHLLLETQRTTLKQVANGDLQVRVPIASNDEFGLIAKNTNHTIEALQAQSIELTKVRDATILALSSLAETRDDDTGAHILRTQQYVKALAEHLKNHPRFSTALNDEQVELIVKSAPLHDVGKVGIPDSVLLKPGRLTETEYKVIQQHPSIGSQAMRAAREELGSNSFLAVACEIMETHHEKWDGSGYPCGLSGDNIPVSGRLMALADVYDALTTARVYKPAFSHEKAKSIIVEGRAKHFDPDIVDAFLEIQEQFESIACSFSNAEAAYKITA